MNWLLVLSFLVAVIVDVAFPIAVGIWLVRRYGLRWDLFGFGAAVFLLSQLLTRIPLVQLVTAVAGKELTATPERTIVWLAVLALTAGLFEEVGRWLGYRWFFRPARRTWTNALLYGAGHEAAESVILVGLSVLNSLAIYLALNLLPTPIAMIIPDTALLQTIFGGLQSWVPLLGAFERICAMAFQISASVLVLQAFLRRNLWWLALAIGWHALVDFVTVLTLYGTHSLGPWSLLLTEGLVFVSALISLVIIRALRPRQLETPPVPDVLPLPAEPPVIPYELDPPSRT